MHHPGFDIRRHTFTRAVRGVDESEVEAALLAAAPAYDEAHAVLQELQQALADTLAERDRLLEAERSVIKLIRTAEEQARMRIGGAHRDATRVVERADAQARELLEGAEAERLTLLRESEAIEQRRQHLVATVSEFVEAMAVKPSMAPDPEPVTLLVEPMESPEWPSVAECAQEDAAAAPSWMVDGDQAGVQEALEQFPTSAVDPEETVAGADVEPVADAQMAWSSDGERGSRRWWPRFSTRHALVAAAAVVMLAAAIASPAVRGWTGASPRTSQPPAGSSPVLAASIVPEPAAADGVPRPAAPDPTEVSSSVNPFADAAPTAPLAIKLTATRACWVGVTVDGETDSVLLEPGDELERSGSKQIRLRIGDAAAATLAVNGQALPPLGRSGQVVDRTFNAEDFAQ